MCAHLFMQYTYILVWNRHTICARVCLRLRGCQLAQFIFLVKMHQFAQQQILLKCIKRTYCANTMTYERVANPTSLFAMLMGIFREDMCSVFSCV